MNAPTPFPSRAKLGDRISDRYTLEQLLRDGELISVYRARADGDDEARYIARVVHGVRPADADRAAAFAAASALLRELQHRAIPTVVAAEVVGTEPVVVTERVDAMTLRARSARQRGVDPQDIAQCLVQVADALDLLHARTPRLIHRRVCPESILVSDDGRAWIEECGLAYALVEAGWSPESVAPASPEYLSPDEAEHRIDPQTDIFALATVAFECLTGAPPFPGDPAVVRAAVLERERPSACALRPDLSRNVDAVLLRAWSSEGCGALERYPSAGALARELLHVLDANVRVTSPHLSWAVRATTPPLDDRATTPAPQGEERLSVQVSDLLDPPAAPPLVASAVQTFPGLSVPPPEPTPPPRAPEPVAPPALPSPLPSPPMTSPRARPVFPENFGPSLVLASLIFAAAFIYVHRNDGVAPPAPTPPLVHQTAALRPEPIAPTAPPPPVHEPVREPAVIGPDAAAQVALDVQAVVDARVASVPTGPTQPSMAEIRSIHTTLEPEMQDCLANSDVRVLRVTVTYLGWNGNARVYIQTPLDDPEKNVCVERAIMRLPVRRFAAQSWRTQYTFNLRR